MAASAKGTNANIVSVGSMDLDVWINAPPEEVWHKAVNEVDAWWIVETKRQVLGVYIEPWPGGRFWRKCDEEGHGLLYGTVSVVDPPDIIHIITTFDMSGVSVGTMTWRLFAQDDGTLFQMSTQAMCELPERTLSEKTKLGGKELLKSLKRYVEEGTRSR